MLFLTADSHLGRVDYSSFSDQTLMEMLVEGLDQALKKGYQDEDGMYRHVCQWTNVTCDADGNVVQIKSPPLTAGSISLEYMPPHVKFFNMRSSNLTGTLETSRLPQTLRTFEIQGNAFCGTVDFTSLPIIMSIFLISRNSFTGSADLRSLPRSLDELGIDDNAFSGALCLTRLPQGLTLLNVSRNAFVGDFVIRNVPKNLYCIHAEENQFNPVAVVPKGTLAALRGSGVESVVDAEGKARLDGGIMIKG